MLDSEREAKRLIDGEWSSWSARGRMHKAYRQMSLTEEEEIPPHRSSRKKKPKHVHKWGEWIKVGEETRRGWRRGPSGNYTRGKPFNVIKWVRVCKKCGQRCQGESTIGGMIKRGRYIYW